MRGSFFNADEDRATEYSFPRRYFGWWLAGGCQGHKCWLGSLSDLKSNSHFMDKIAVEQRSFPA